MITIAEKTKPLLKRFCQWKVLLTVAVILFILLSAVIVLTLHFTKDPYDNIDIGKFL